jgi:hypothetical protein
MLRTFYQNIFKNQQNLDKYKFKKRPGIPPERSPLKSP